MLAQSFNGWLGRGQQRPNRLLWRRPKSGKLRLARQPFKALVSLDLSVLSGPSDMRNPPCFMG